MFHSIIKPGVAMLNALHSYYKQLCLALLVLLGLACGHLAGSMLQIKLRPSLSATTKALPPIAVQRQTFVESDLNQILQQNIFDAGQRSAALEINPAAESQATAQSTRAVSGADLKLIGTVVADGRSLALIENRQALEIFRLDDEIPGGGGVVETIERNKVTIRTDNQELLTLFLHEADSSPGAPPTTTSAASAGASQAQEENGLRGTVREVEENRYVVSQDLVESVRENFSSQLRLAQMQPHLVNGQTEGFFIRRINPRSVLAKMGLERGDVVVDVNNIKLDSPEKALQVFQQLREARQITVAVLRRGQPLTFQYEIE